MTSGKSIILLVSSKSRSFRDFSVILSILVSVFRSLINLIIFIKRINSIKNKLKKLTKSSKKLNGKI